MYDTGNFYVLQVASSVNRDELGLHSSKDNNSNVAVNEQASPQSGEWRAT